MALLMKNAIFFHIPKTGGTWVRQVLKKANVPTTQLCCTKCSVTGNYANCCFHTQYPRITLPDDRKRLRFAFVRNPVDYYQSYWAFKMRVGWDMSSNFEKKVAHEDFRKFVQAVITHFPGWVSNSFENAIGTKENPYIDFVGKQETLCLDLLWALRTADQPIDEEVVFAFPPKNVTSLLPEWQEACTYTPSLRNAVLHAERKALERFGYW